MRLLDKVLDLIITRKCAGCGKPSEVFCESCASTSYTPRVACLFCGQRNHAGEVCAACKRRSETPLYRVLWAGRYDDELKKAVWALKYEKRKEMAKPLSELLARKFFEVYEGSLPAEQFARHGYFSKQQDMRALKSDTSFAVIPIPLHFKKEYERGFNQAELLAREFCKITSIPFLTGVLQKIRETTEQVKVENKELRLTNLENAFSVSLSNPIAKWPTIILIDDVATTGATLTHAARALTNAGAKNIIGLVVAHGG